MSKAEFGPYVWKNGEFVNFSNAMVHSCTHSLQYSGLIFEGIACYFGRVFKLKEHINRFFTSARLMGLRLNFAEQEIIDAIEKLVVMNNCLNGRFYIRPAAWCGEEQISIRRNNQALAQTYIFTMGMRPLSISNRANLTLSSWVKASTYGTPHQCKTSGNYLSSILAKREAERFGSGEALLLDCYGRIAECGSASIFFVKRDGSLITPKPECCLNGITRQTILALCAKLGLVAQERDIFLSDLTACSEAFLTGTAIGLLPVQSLYCPKDGLKLEFKLGATTELLFDSYANLVSAKR